MTRREELYPEIRRLREDEGLMWREIGDRLGLARATVHEYYADPAGAKVAARKARNNGVCVDCGAETRGGGAKVPPERCFECGIGPWTREGVLEAFHDWAGTHGGIPPRVEDTRGEPALPSENPVARLFGSWNAGLLAGGYALHQDKRPETSLAMVEAVRAGESAASIGDRFGCTARNVYKRVAHTGVRVRELRRAS